MINLRKIAAATLMMTTLMLMGNTAYAAQRTNMTYLYSGTSNNYITYIDKTQNSIDVVSPSLFDINTDGTVKLTSKINKAFVQTMHAQGITVTPFISNHWDRELGRKALSNYKEYAEGIVKIVKEWDLDGVNVDIENLTQADKESFVTFVSYLKSIMPEDKTVTLAVAANPNDFTTGWQGSYDLPKLNLYVDAFVLMTYDQSFYGSAPGPVAGYDFVEQSIKTMLKYVPAEKVLMGIPFYGRYWNSSEFKGGSAATLKSIDSVIASFGATSTYSQKYKTPYLTFRVTNSSPPVSLGGGKLTPGYYTMWYENDQSIKEKLILVEKYNLMGTASWALGYEDTSIWNDYTNWLNGDYYKDTDNSWAKEEIDSVTIRGYMSGKDVHNFAPKEYMTRAEFAAVICRVMDYSSIIVSDGVFKDVKSSSWAYDYINTLYSRGLMKGSNGYFRPNDKISREEVAVVLHRALNGNGYAPSYGFSDVNISRWSTPAINYCANAGIFNGYHDNTFKPYNHITREEISALLLRLENYR